MVILRGTEGREAGPSPAFCGQWQRLLCRGWGSYVGAFTSGLLRRGFYVGAFIFMSGLEPRPRDGLTHGSDSPRKKEGEKGIVREAFPCVSPFRVRGFNPGKCPDS